MAADSPAVARVAELGCEDLMAEISGEFRAGLTSVLRKQGLLRCRL